MVDLKPSAKGSIIQIAFGVTGLLMPFLILFSDFDEKKHSLHCSME